MNCLFNNPKSSRFFPKSYKGQSVDEVSTVLRGYRKELLGPRPNTCFARESEGGSSDAHGTRTLTSRTMT